MHQVLIGSDALGEALRALTEPLPSISTAPLQSLPGDASDGFFCATRRVLVTGTARHGLQSIWFDRRHVLQEFRVAEVACRSFSQSAVGAERALTQADATMTERVLASPEAAALVVEWTAHDDVAFDLSWTSPTDSLAVCAFSSAVELASVQSGTTTRTTAHATLTAGASLRLLIAADAATLREADPARWARAHAGAAERRKRALLAIECSDAQLAQQWEWSKHVVAMQTLRGNADRELVLALIVLGDFASARQLLDPAVAPYYHAASGDEPSAVPPSAPDVSEADWQPADDAAATIVSFARMVLGYAPDAARGRLTLRPRMQEWERLVVHNVPIGDARVRLFYERTASGCCFRVAQIAGAYPVRLIFEPLLTQQPQQVRIDGVIAQLDLKAAAGLVIAPVQLMLDNEREIEFTYP